MNNIRIIHIHKASEESNSFVEYTIDGKVQMLKVLHFVKRYGYDLIETFKRLESKSNRTKNGILIVKGQ